MPLETSFTRLLGVRQPIALAPMGGSAGGALAAAVSNAGGLGLLGAGNGDRACPRRARWSTGSRAALRTRWRGRGDGNGRAEAAADGAGAVTPPTRSRAGPGSAGSRGLGRAPPPAG